MDPLAPAGFEVIHIEPAGTGAFVTLRRCVRQTETTESDDGSAGAVLAAEEVSGTLSWVPTVVELAACFDEAWEAFAHHGMTDRELLMRAIEAAELEDIACGTRKQPGATHEGGPTAKEAQCFQRF